MRNPQYTPGDERHRRRFWATVVKKTHEYVTDADKAYLHTYVQIAKDEFYGVGIPLRDGTMLPDKARMRALYKQGWVVFDEHRTGATNFVTKLSKFTPTDKYWSFVRGLTELQDSINPQDTYPILAAQAEVKPIEQQ